MPYTGKLGVAIIGFDRYRYFKKMIASVEVQTSLENADFHLFLEGSKNRFSGRLAAAGSVLDKTAAIFIGSNLPNKTLHRQNDHVGTAINQFEAVEYMAERYDYFLVLEDDVILSPHYFHLMRVAFDLLPTHEDIFSISLGFIRNCQAAQIHKNLDKIMYKNTHWWAEGWSAKNWKKVRKYFLYYYQFVQNCDYKERPADDITRMFNSHGFNIPQTSQDAGKDFALFMSKMRRVVTVVNRGLSIGEHGTHFRPGFYKRLGLAQQKPFTFISDKNLKEFQLCE